MVGPLLLSLLLLANPQNGPTVRPKSPFVLTPSEAVIAAADVAPAAVGGVFEMQVRGSGRVDGKIYLNSERDYRDQRSVSVVILPVAFEALRERFGDSPDRALAGKMIRVRGYARRVRIDFLSDNGRPSGKYYYQTHIAVTRADQIRLVHARAQENRS